MADRRLGCALYDSAQTYQLAIFPQARAAIPATTAGIVLGVSVFVGMHVANQSVLRGFSETVDRIAGKTQPQVTAGESSFDENVLDRVQSAPSVQVAVPVIESVVNLKDKEQGSLLVLGVDMTGDRSLRDYDLESGEEAIVDDPLVFLAQPDSLIVTQPFAERNGLDVGGELVLGTAVGEKAFVIRGIMKPSGLTSAFGGNLAILDIYAARRRCSAAVGSSTALISRSRRIEQSPTASVSSSRCSDLVFKLRHRRLAGSNSRRCSLPTR